MVHFGLVNANVDYSFCHNLLEVVEPYTCTLIHNLDFLFLEQLAFIAIKLLPLPYSVL